MKELSFWESRKTLTALILCLGLFTVSTLQARTNTSDNAVLSTQQQKQTAEGVVQDSSGEPVIGASVVEKGTTNGTITDFDGKFSLQVAPGATIIVSYIGYQTKEVTYTPGRILNVTLAEDTEVLDEVVVVGFGTQKKVNLTGSVSTVDSKELSSRPVTSATQALQGLVPGLQISQNSGSLNSTASINIRGVGTIGEGSSGDPLILIDGMEGDLNTINVQDIENISVLKDAAAASIYGSRAPFGVILVTTKSGKSGKTQINYNNSFRWSSPINMPHTMDSYTFATYFNDGCDNTPGWSHHFDDEHLARILAYQQGTLTSSIPAGTNGYWMDGYAAGNDNVDWYDVVYKGTTFSQEHNVSAQGGSEKVNYYVSFNYLDQGGLINLGTEGLDRYNITAKIKAELTSWAKLNVTTRWMRQDYIQPSYYNDGLYQNLGRQGWPTLPLYDPNGYYYDSPSPALSLATGGDSTTQTDRNYVQAALVLEPIKDWVTNIEFNYQVYSQTEHTEYQQTYNHDVEGNAYLYNTSSSVSEEYTKENSWSLNVYSTYSKTFNEKHNTKFMLGFQSESMSQKNYGLTNSGILIPSLAVVNLTSGLDNDGNAVTPSVWGENNEWTTAGFFGRVNYDYDGRYLVEGNFRYDGTSRFRKENRWIALPSASLGWNIAREKFWENNLDVVNTLKLRASWGLLGNQNTDNWYQTYRTIGYYASSGTWLQDGVAPNIAEFPDLVSEDLTWEKVETYNIGLDFGLFNNRLTGYFEYFIRNTKNMVGNAAELPAVLGADVPLTNNTDLRTTGWDLELSWNDRLNNGMGYSVKVTLSDSRTKITSYPNNPTNSISTYIAGQYINEIWGYETIGIAKTDEEMAAHLAVVDQSALGSDWGAGDIMYADLDGDGKISSGSQTLGDHGDLKIIGNSTPRYLFSIDLGWNWKGFDVRAFFQGVLKRDFAPSSGYFWGADSSFWWSMGLTPHTDYFRDDADHPLGLNLDSYYPRPVFESSKNTQTQSRYIQDASYIRLKNLQIGYTLPAKVTKKFGCSNARVFFSAENLWTGTSLSELYDPETVDGGWNGCVYPLSKTLSCGVSLTF